MRTPALACLLALATMVPATATHAGVPSPALSTLQGEFLDVGGATNGSPDACSDGRCAEFTVTVRDFSGRVIPGSAVVVDFSECPDIQVACDQLYSVTGQSNEGGKRVETASNGNGRATFRILGAARATGAGAPGAPAGQPCAKVFADGVQLNQRAAVAAYDVNGAGSPAVNGADVSFVATEAGLAALAKPAYARVDYNHSGTVNGADVARAASMAGDAMLGTGSATTGPFCP